MLEQQGKQQFEQLQYKLKTELENTLATMKQQYENDSKLQEEKYQQQLSAATTTSAQNFNQQTLTSGLSSALNKATTGLGNMTQSNTTQPGSSAYKSTASTPLGRLSEGIARYATTPSSTSSNSIDFGEVDSNAVEPQFTPTEALNRGLQPNGNTFTSTGTANGEYIPSQSFVKGGTLNPLDKGGDALPSVAEVKKSTMESGGVGANLISRSGSKVEPQAGTSGMQSTSETRDAKSHTSDLPRSFKEELENANMEDFPDNSDMRILIQPSTSKGPSKWVKYHPKL